MVVLGSPEFIPHPHLEITNWFLFCQLGFLTFLVHFDQSLSKTRMTSLSGSHTWDPYWRNRGIHWMQTTFHDFPASFLSLPVWTLQIHVSYKMHCKPLMRIFSVILCCNELPSYKVLKTPECQQFLRKKQNQFNNILKCHVKRESCRSFDVVIMTIFIQSNCHSRRGF